MAARRFLPASMCWLHTLALAGCASIGRRGVASSGGPRVVGAGVVDLRVGDHVRLEQAGALDFKMTAVVVAAGGEASVEVVLPEGRSCLQLSCSGWSWVAWVDAVGGAPHGYFTDDGEVLAAARRRPHGLGSRLGRRDLGSDLRAR